MKKSFYAILVIALSLIGANLLASQVDMNIKRVSTETNDSGSGPNGNGEGGTRNMITKEK